jgi:hypothetical protein
MIDAGLAGAIGAGIPLIIWEGGRLIARRIGKSSTIPRRMDRMESTVIMIARESAVQTGALKATLEAVSGIQCNGNVHKAIENIDAMATERDEFYRQQAITEGKI